MVVLDVRTAQLPGLPPVASSLRPAHAHTHELCGALATRWRGLDVGSHASAQRYWMALGLVEYHGLASFVSWATIVFWAAAAQCRIKSFSFLMDLEWIQIDAV
jgi:hypothetical protein